MEQVDSYKYLGIIIDSKGSYRPQNEAIKRKGVATAITLKNLKNKTAGPNFKPFIQVLHAKLVPALTYGSESMRGRDTKTLDTTIAKAIRLIFNLPRYTSPAQIRLEFEIQKQDMA